MAGNAAQTSREMPAKISFWRPVASIARATRASSKALTEERSMISTGKRLNEFRECRPHMLSRAVVVTTIGSSSTLAALARATKLCFSFASRIIADARHETDLMVDKDERGVLGTQRFVRADLS